MSNRDEVLDYWGEPSSENAPSVHYKVEVFSTGMFLFTQIVGQGPTARISSVAIHKRDIPRLRKAISKGLRVLGMAGG